MEGRRWKGRPEVSQEEEKEEQENLPLRGPNLPSALATQLSQPDVPFVTPALDAVPECESHLGVQETVEEGHGESLGIKHSEINWGNRFHGHSVSRPTTHCLTGVWTEWLGGCDQ